MSAGTALPSLVFRVLRVFGGPSNARPSSKRFFELNHLSTGSRTKYAKRRGNRDLGVTSFWSRYRDDAHNPDLDPNFKIKQAVIGLNVGKHRAISKDDTDTIGSSITNPPQNGITPHLQVIACGLSLCLIEQGGTSLYPSLAQTVSDPEVLRVDLSIGPTEAMHFQTWQDKAGNALPVSSDGAQKRSLSGTFWAPHETPAYWRNAFTP